MPKPTPIKKRRQMSGRFKRFRAKHRLTQAQLASLLDLDRTEVIHIEMSRRYPHYSTLGRFEELENRIRRGRELGKAAKTLP